MSLIDYLIMKCSILLSIYSFLSMILYDYIIRIIVHVMENGIYIYWIGSHIIGLIDSFDLMSIYFHIVMEMQMKISSYDESLYL